MKLKYKDFEAEGSADEIASMIRRLDGKPERAKPRDESDAYAEDSYLIAYNGREYNPKNFKEIYPGFF